MTLGNWIAIVSAAIAFLGLAAGMMVLAVQVAFRFGEHHSRLSVVERDTAQLKIDGKATADAISKISGMEKLLAEVRVDVKSILGGRPGRRSAQGSES
jgi:hypothetical protein